MPRPPHLALMCVGQLTDRPGKRLGGMGNCRKKEGLIAPFSFSFPYKRYLFQIL